MKTETPFAKVGRTHREAEKAARHAETASYAADAAHVALIGAKAVQEATYKDKWDLAAQADKAADEAAKASDAYSKIVEDRRLDSAKATLVADAAQQS